MPKKASAAAFRKPLSRGAGNVFRYSAPHADAVKSAICRKAGRQAKIERVCAAEKEGPASVVQDMGHLPCRTAVRLRSSAFPTDMNASRSGQQNAPEIPKTFPFSNVFSVAKGSLPPRPSADLC